MLIAILTSLDIEVENKDEVLCLIDMGFSAVQVSEAINMVNSLEVETLLSELTKETTCKSKEYNELTKYLIVDIKCHDILSIFSNLSENTEYFSFRCK